jgi:putative oxidoreductase
MDMGDALGKAVLRITIGGLILMHGVHKLLDGIAPIKQMIASHGLPELLAYGVYLGEIVGPLLVIAGLFARIGGLLIVANMIVAVLLVHTAMLLSVGPMGGYALELQACYLFGGLAIALMGAGGLSLGGKEGRWN